MITISRISLHTLKFDLTLTIIDLGTIQLRKICRSCLENNVFKPVQSALQPFLSLYLVRSLGHTLLEMFLELLIEKGVNN